MMTKYTNEEIQSAIDQLKSLRDNSESFIDGTEPDSIWHDDIKAIDIAIDVLEEASRA